MLTIRGLLTTVRSRFSGDQENDLKKDSKGIRESCINKINEVIDRSLSGGRFDVDDINNVYGIIYGNDYKLSPEDADSIATWATLTIFQRLRDSGYRQIETYLFKLVNLWFSRMQEKKSERPPLSGISFENIVPNIRKVSFNFLNDSAAVGNSDGNEKNPLIKDFELSANAQANSGATTLVEAYFGNLLFTMCYSRQAWLLPVAGTKEIKKPLLENFIRFFPDQDCQTFDGNMRNKMKKLFQSFLEGKLALPENGDVSDKITGYIVDGLGIRSKSPDERREMIDFFLKGVRKYINQNEDGCFRIINSFINTLEAQKSCAQMLLNSAKEQLVSQQAERKLGVGEVHENLSHLVVRRPNSIEENLALQIQEMEKLLTSLEKLQNNAQDAEKIFGQSINNLKNILQRCQHAPPEKIQEESKQPVNTHAMVDVQTPQSLPMREDVYLACIDRLKVIITDAFSKNQFDVESIYKKVIDIVSDNNTVLDEDDKYTIATWAALRIFNGIRDFKHDKYNKREVDLMKLVNTWFLFVGNRPSSNKLLSDISVEYIKGSGYKVSFCLLGNDGATTLDNDAALLDVTFIDTFFLSKKTDSHLDMRSAAEILFFHLLQTMIYDDYKCLSPGCDYENIKKSLTFSFTEEFTLDLAVGSSAEKKKKTFTDILQGNLGSKEIDELIPPNTIIDRLVQAIVSSDDRENEDTTSRITAGFFRYIDIYLDKHEKSFRERLEVVAKDVDAHITSVSNLLIEKQREVEKLKQEMEQQESAGNVIGKLKYRLQEKDKHVADQKELDQQIEVLQAVLANLKSMQAHAWDAKQIFSKAINNVNLIKSKYSQFIEAKEREKKAMEEELERKARREELERKALNQSIVINIPSSAEEPTNSSETADGAQKKKNPIRAFFQRIWQKIWNWWKINVF